MSYFINLKKEETFAELEGIAKFRLGSYRKGADRRSYRTSG